MKFHKWNGKGVLRTLWIRRYYMDKSCEMEESKVTALVKKLDSMVVPPAVARELGLEKDWKKSISPAFAEKVAKTALKYGKTLKELSKY